MLVTVLDDRTMVSVDVSCLQGWFVPFDNKLVLKCCVLVAMSRRYQKCVFNRLGAGL